MQAETDRFKGLNNNVAIIQAADEGTAVFFIFVNVVVEFKK